MRKVGDNNNDEVQTNNTENIQYLVMHLLSCVTYVTINFPLNSTMVIDPRGDQLGIQFLIWLDLGQCGLLA